VTYEEREWAIINRRCAEWWANRRKITAEACPTCGRPSGLMHTPINRAGSSPTDGRQPGSNQLTGEYHGDHR